MSSVLRSRDAEPAFSGIFSGTFLSCVGLILVVVYGGRIWSALPWLGSTPAPRSVAPALELSPEEQATIALFESASPSVVSIQALNLYRTRRIGPPQEVPEGSGSGFVWDEAGHVVTNFHVVRNGTLFRVFFQDGRSYPAEVVGVALDYDLAVLQVQDAPRERLRPLPVGSSEVLRVGQRVLAIGYPFGLEQTLTSGIVSGLDRWIQSQTNLAIHGVIQTDAAINPGNSGGPLLDSSGRLIGINTAIATSSGASAGVGFAVPVDTVNRIVPRILEEGSIERAGLGIKIGEDFRAREEGLEGAVVDSVAPGGPADRAKLVGLREVRGETRVGDVIVAVDGRPIRRQADLFEVLETYRAGDEVLLEVSRPEGPGRELKEIRVRLVPLR